MRGSRAALALGAAVAVAAVAFDPRAPAADAKRTLGLLLAVALLAVAIAVPSRPIRKLRVAPAALFFLGFVAWSGLTLAWGVPLGARDLGTWTAAAALLLVVMRWPAPRARAAAGWAALLAGGGAGAIALWQVARGASGIWIHGGQGNANWLGLLTALTIPLTIGVICGASAEENAGARKRRDAKSQGGRAGPDPLRLFAPLRRCAPALNSPLPFASLALQMAGLLLSHSRVAWAAVLVSCLPLVWTSIRARRAAAVAALGLVLAASPAIAGPTMDPEPAGDVPIPLAWKGRTWIWRTSAEAAVSALPAGAGLGGFAHAYLAAQGTRLARLSPREASRAFVNATTAHCDWLEVLVDSGPLALLLLALAVGAGALGSVRARRFPEAAALLSFAVCAAGDSPLRQPGVALILGLALGALPRTRVLAAPARVLAAARIASLAAAALLLSEAARGWIAERRLTAAREADPEGQRALLASAARADPRSGEVALERGLRELDLGHAEIALAELRRSRPLLANVGTAVAIGNAEVALGDLDDAVAAYERALVADPGSFRAHANLGQTLITLGRLDEADRHLAIAAALWPGHPRLREMIDRARRARIDRGATGGEAGDSP